MLMNSPDPVRKSIAENFNEYFKVRLANTDALREIVYKIRYDVYCAELGWEKDCPVDVEKDMHDDHAVHCLLEHRRTGTYAGTIRLVQTSEAHQAPFEVYCQEAIDPSIIGPAQLPRGRFGEISRLAVPAEFRKRKGEQGKPFVMDDTDKNTLRSYSEDERRQFPNIAIGLYLASLAYVDLLKYDYVFVMMEPRLRRHLRRFGIEFQAGGEPIDYHGTRGLFYLDQKDMTRHFPQEIDELYGLIHRSMAEQLAAPPGN